ncbi:hypothetical protein FKW77_008710 [Venturia effusa]|uniref:BTB domain-containing protein n=1 Tax=Venturia effusa TaxID=50376 RepID=A0A517LJM5_9PEZI|nr:hypothetical protein FKW77_008710 [Venturia effusa]
MDSETAPASITVDEDGDLILLVGSEAQTRILVSSKVLTISSKVFKAMLSKSFKEARELAESANNNETYELQLPDDDAAAMIVLCKVIHHRSCDVLAESVTMSLLQKFASHVHKYDCIEAARVQVVSDWIVKFADDPDQTLGLAVVSYLLDIAESFTKFTRLMLMNDQIEVVTVREAWDTAHQIPETVFEILKEKRQAAFEFISEKISQRLDGVMNRIPCLSREHGLDSPGRFFTQHDARLAQRFFMSMRVRISWPHRIQDRSLHGTLIELCKIRDEAKNTGKVYERCAACETSLGQHLTQIIDGAEAAIQGVCLDCLRHKGDPEKECRVQHEAKAKAIIEEREKYRLVFEAKKRGITLWV